MNMRLSARESLSWLILFTVSAGSVLAQQSVVGPGVPPFEVRPGYRVDLVAENIGEVRFIEFGQPGILYVSQPRTGAIITLQQKAGVWSKINDFTTDKPTAHGMHYFDGWLWFTQSGVIWKARDTDGDGKADEEIKVTDDLPSGGGHWWRPILVTPDGFYTSIGDSHNISDERDTERQKIWHFNLDGSGKKLFVSGIRNTEKLRLRPGTDEVWGADHGSDNYGKDFGEKRGNQPITDQVPPCEFNHYIEGGFYGHPFIVGPGLPRLEYAELPELLELAGNTILPAWLIGPHWAPNGWTFAKYDALGLKGDAMVACHGSWNSSVKVGYCVLRILFDEVTGAPMGHQTLVKSITPDQVVLGRPCDVAEAPDGSLFFSDDSKRRIYRISRYNDTAQLSTRRVDASVDVGTAESAKPFGALAYFQNRCASCHGNYGEAYGEKFARDISETSLHQQIIAMAEGPAGAPLEGEQLKMLDQFHQALRDGLPYAAITSRGDDGLVYGEALPGSRLELELGGQHIDVPLTGHTWEVQLPTGDPSDDAVLHVRRNSKEMSLSLSHIVD